MTGSRRKTVPKTRTGRKAGAKSLAGTTNGLNFESLVGTIAEIHAQLAAQAVKAVNVSLTLRNWLIGGYIREYELGGDDRAAYGEGLFDALAERLTARGVSNCNRRQLYRYRDFYCAYPGIAGTLSPQWERLLPAARAEKWGRRPHNPGFLRRNSSSVFPTAISRN